MSEHTSTDKILYTREQLFTIRPAQTERQRLKNTQIVVKKLLKKFVKESEENREALKND